MKAAIDLICDVAKQFQDRRVTRRSTLPRQWMKNPDEASRRIFANSAMNESATFSAAAAPAFRPRFDIGAQRIDCGREPHVDTHGAADEFASWPLLDYSDCEPT